MIRTSVLTVIAVLALCIFLNIDAQAHPAWGIVVDRQGKVYFSDLTTVRKIDAQGKVSVFRPPGDRHTHDLNIDAADNLYGADNSYEPATERFFSALWKMTPAGDFSYLLTSTDTPPKGTSIWKDHDGNGYHVTAYPERELLVLKRTPQGTVTAMVGTSDVARQFRQKVPYSIGGVAIGEDGALYFTHEANVSKLSKSGVLTSLIRNLALEGDSKGPAGETRLLGIVVDAQGNAFVADHGNGRVLKIGADGKRATVIDGEESWYPAGVALRAGELYILEEGHTPAFKPLGTRVRKLSTNGKVTVLANVTEQRVGSASVPAGAPSSGEISKNVSKSEQSIPYLTIGTGVLVLAVIAARAWRRMYRSHGAV